MSKKLNIAFLSAYIQLDNDCAEKFGITTNGVTEYINRLNNIRFAPGRDEVLPTLVRYRTIRDKFTHESTGMKHSSEITKADLKWIRNFNKDLKKKKDPISIYLKKARKYARRRKLRRVLAIAAAVVIVAAAAGLAIIFF